MGEIKLKSFLVKAGAAVTAIISAGTAVVGVTTTINAESSEEINDKINQSNNAALRIRK